MLVLCVFVSVVAVALARVVAVAGAVPVAGAVARVVAVAGAVPVAGAVAVAARAGTIACVSVDVIACVSVCCRCSY